MVFIAFKGKLGQATSEWLVHPPQAGQPTEPEEKEAKGRKEGEGWKMEGGGRGSIISPNWR